MLMLPDRIRIFFRSIPTDMRLGYDGLCAIIQNEFRQDPTSGNLFVFVNKANNRSKMLLFDAGGFWLMCRRLERGTFAMPKANDQDERHITLSRVQWTMFLDGIVAKEIIHKKRYFPAAVT